MKRTRKFTAISLAFLLAFLTFGDMTKVQAESGNETPNEIEITADSEQVPAKEDESLDLAQLRNGNEALNNTLGPVQSYEGEAPAIRLPAMREFIHAVQLQHAPAARKSATSGVDRR